MDIDAISKRYSYVLPCFADFLSRNITSSYIAILFLSRFATKFSGQMWTIIFCPRKKAKKQWSRE